MRRRLIISLLLLLLATATACSQPANEPPAASPPDAVFGIHDVGDAPVVGNIEHRLVRAEFGPIAGRPDVEQLQVTLTARNTSEASVVAAEPQVNLYGSDGSPRVEFSPAEGGTVEASAEGWPLGESKPVIQPGGEVTLTANYTVKKDENGLVLLFSTHSDQPETRWLIR